jgi:hypothetical protein
MRAPNLVALVSSAAFVLAVSAAPGCVCRGSAAPRDPALEAAAFGDLAAPQDVILDPYLALARAVIAGGDRASLPRAPGRRVFLTKFPERAARVTTTGIGDSLERAVIVAAEAMPRDDAGGSAFRLALDVVTNADPIERDAMAPAWADLGLEGYALAPGKDALGYVMPSDLIFDKRFEGGKKPKIDLEKLLQAMRARLAAPASTSDDHLYRFHTKAVVDSATHDAALRVSRGWVERAPGVAAPELLDAVRAGAEYLCRVMDDKGHYAYMVHPVDARADSSYGMLRHCGTTFALMEAYGELHTPLFLDKGERALAYIKQHLETYPSASDKMTYVLDTNDEEQQKVGGAGLALIAFAEHAKATGKKEELETMRAFARFIVHQQAADGHFRNNRDLEREGVAPPGPPLKKEVIYYVGEALLGLMKLYALDPDEKWLEAAKKGADWCVETRDATMTVDTQEHDHWLSYALSELHRVTKKQSYADHAFRIARAILSRQHMTSPPAPDFVGAFYNDAQATPAATRLEAFGADIAIARALGQDEAWLVGPAQAMARFTRAQQLDAESAFFARDPARVIGGVREGLFVYDIRIDYVQHSMSAWLHLARLLRDSK